MAFLGPTGAARDIANRDPGDQEDADVLALPDGGWVAVWKTESTEGQPEVGLDPGRITWRRFDADGRALGPETRVSSTDEEPQDLPQIALLRSGGWVVTWVEYEDELGTVRGRIFDENGTPLGDDFGLPGPVTQSRTTPTVAGLDDGGFLVAIQDGFDSLLVQRFDATGSAVGTTTEIGSPDLSFETLPTLTPLTNGGILASWEGGNIGFRDTVLRGRLLDDAGTPTGDVLALTPGFSIFGSGGAEHDVAPLPDGGFVMAWVETFQIGVIGPTSSRILTQAFDADGTPRDTPTGMITSASDDGVRGQTPSVTALPDGGWVVAWSNITSLFFPQASQVVARRFQADGSPVGAEFRLEPKADGVADDTTLATTTAGDLVALWMQRPAVAEDSDVRLRTYDVTQVGTGGADIIDGTSIDDTIAGRGGVDLIRGLRGDDTLDGGAGNDTLIGGSGDDLLTGGKGRDELSGGKGADSLEGGNANDSLSGGNGQDDLKGGNGRDDLSGGKGADILTGGNGNDTLDGGAGKDVLTGGRGNDTLKGGTGSDTFVFTAGRDRIEDFRTAFDTLRIDGDLMDGATTLRALGRLADDRSDNGDGQIVFDFGSGNRLTVQGVDTFADLRGDIEFI